MVRLTDEQAVAEFRAFLRHKTVSSTGHLDGTNDRCVAFLAKLCADAGLRPTTLQGPPEGRPVLVAELQGTDPTLDKVQRGVPTPPRAPAHRAAGAAQFPLRCRSCDG